MTSLLTLWLLASPDPALVEALTALQRPRSVVANLEQTKTMRAFKRPQIATGRLIVVPPRRVRWEYQSPYRAILVINGDKMSMEYPELGRKQVFDLSKDPAMKRVIDTILFFLEADANRVLERFEVTATRQEQHTVLALTPRSKTARGLVKRIEATVDRQRGVLTSLTIDEPDGDSTQLKLTNARTNEPVDETLLTP